jgi:probable rRNA maturation factor
MRARAHESCKLLQLDLSYAARRPWVPARAKFSVWVEAALAGAGARGRGARPAARALTRSGSRDRVVVSVRAVGSARSRSLNSVYRGKDRPTNVLSFQGPGAMPDGSRILGELVICVPVVAREARTQGKSAESHWAHMTVHGVLHLLGFDHERDREARKMAAQEIQILDRLGFSNPYA